VQAKRVQFPGRKGHASRHALIRSSLDEVGEVGADLAVMHEQTTIQVAVYWTGEGYGTPEEAGSMEEALAKAAALTKLGYASTSSGAEIHIIETTRKVCRYEPT
jgi:hypothetical protein